MAEKQKKTYQKPEATKEELRKMLLETNEKLALANERLIRQEKERTEFFANLSHDLRSSLSVIAGGVELLRTEPDLSPENAELLKSLSARTAFMKRLIEDLFFLAKMDSRTDIVSLQEIDLRAFLEEYMISLSADSRFSDRPLTLDIPEGIPETVQLDPELTIRVLDNLFSNAWKYSPAGTEIALQVQEKEGRLLLCVSDSGEGIAPSELLRIFERTYRSRRERSPEDESSGLGLSIVKSIVESYGGSVWAESEVGKGSTFYLTLPEQDRKDEASRETSEK